MTPALARNTDPQTSHDAAARQVKSGQVRIDRDRVLLALWNKGKPRRISTKRLAIAAQLDRYMVARRMADLKHAKMVRTDGRDDTGELCVLTAAGVYKARRIGGGA